MEYVLSNAAVSRSFTAYLGAAIGISATERWRITISGLPNEFNQMDLLAVGVVLIISLCICYRFISFPISPDSSANRNWALTNFIKSAIFSSHPPFSFLQYKGELGLEHGLDSTSSGLHLLHYIAWFLERRLEKHD